MREIHLGTVAVRTGNEGALREAAPDDRKERKYHAGH